MGCVLDDVRGQGRLCGGTSKRENGGRALLVLVRCLGKVLRREARHGVHQPAVTALVCGASRQAGRQAGGRAGRRLVSCTKQPLRYPRTWYTVVVTAEGQTASWRFLRPKETSCWHLDVWSTIEQSYNGNRGRFLTPGEYEVESLVFV